MKNKPVKHQHVIPDRIVKNWYMNSKNDVYMLSDNREEVEQVPGSKFIGYIRSDYIYELDRNNPDNNLEHKFSVWEGRYFKLAEKIYYERAKVSANSYNVIPMQPFNYKQRLVIIAYNLIQKERIPNYLRKNTKKGRKIEIENFSKEKLNKLLKMFEILNRFYNFDNETKIYKEVEKMLKHDKNSNFYKINEFKVKVYNEFKNYIYGSSILASGIIPLPINGEIVGDCDIMYPVSPFFAFTKVEKSKLKNFNEYRNKKWEEMQNIPDKIIKDMLGINSIFIVSSNTQKMLVSFLNKKEIWMSFSKETLDKFDSNKIPPLFKDKGKRN